MSNDNIVFLIYVDYDDRVNCLFVCLPSCADNLDHLKNHEIRAFKCSPVTNLNDCDIIDVKHGETYGRAYESEFYKELINEGDNDEEQTVYTYLP